MDKSQAGKLGYEKTKHILDQHRLEISQQTFEEYEANPKYCPFCGTKIVFQRRSAKFCNSSCSASFNNARRDSYDTNKVRLKPTELCVCGKPKLKRTKYCKECAEKHVYQLPKSVELAKTDEFRKKLLIEIRGYRCEVCMLSDWMGKPIPIELHHIDGNTDNNMEDNLQLLCSNCHGQTNTHRSRNKNGKRQLMRRKRYADGKTW